ncbi:MAG: ATP-binding cassette domain-containing protein [Leptospiraceae bacterium]|nr:ATP-binding cassette domain-containing protein [Leptospiraceae bacterium]
MRIFDKFLLKDINVKISNNTITGLIGNSGSGKSTLFKCIFGIQIPHNANVTGEIFIFGEKLNRVNIQQIQPVFQDPISYFNPRWNLFKILKEPLDIRFHLTENEKRQRIVSLLEEFGFYESSLNKNIGKFSGGEMQRLSILRAILAEPKIILMDEPVSALDPLVQKEAVIFIKKICELKKLTILFISHDIEIVRWLCEEIYVMRNGQIVENGKTKKVFLDPEQEYTKSLLDLTYSTN